MIVAASARRRAASGWDDRAPRLRIASSRSP